MPTVFVRNARRILIPSTDPTNSAAALLQWNADLQFQNGLDTFAQQWTTPGPLNLAALNSGSAALANFIDRNLYSVGLLGTTYVPIIYNGEVVAHVTIVTIDDSNNAPLQAVLASGGGGTVAVRAAAHIAFAIRP